MNFLGALRQLTREDGAIHIRQVFLKATPLKSTDSVTFKNRLNPLSNTFSTVDNYNNIYSTFISNEEKKNLTTSILSSDASDFLALALALAVIESTAVVTCKGTRTITHSTFVLKVSSRPGYSYHKVCKLLRRLTNYIYSLTMY